MVITLLLMALGIIGNSIAIVMTNKTIRVLTQMLDDRNHPYGH